MRRGLYTTVIIYKQVHFKRCQYCIFIEMIQYGRLIFINVQGINVDDIILTTDEEQLIKDTRLQKQKGELLNLEEVFGD